MNTKSDSLLSILNTLIKPALGCTEIGIVAYACGVCSKYATGKITSVDVKVSQYVFRNVACVGVPNLGFCGIKTIVAGGLFVKEPEKKLQILSSIKQEDIPAIKKLLPYINVEVVKNVDPVYTSVLLKTDKGEVIESLIEQIHDNLIYVKYNGKDINISYLQNKKTIDEQSSNEKKYKCSDFSLNDIYDFSNKCNSNDIDFLFEADKLNELLVDYGEKNNPSTSLGKVFSKTIDGKEN
jgi:L-cysteine desulfidase